MRLDTQNSDFAKISPATLPSGLNLRPVFSTKASFALTDASLDCTANNCTNNNQYLLSNKVYGAKPQIQNLFSSRMKMPQDSTFRIILRMLFLALVIAVAISRSTRLAFSTHLPFPCSKLLQPSGSCGQEGCAYPSKQWCPAWTANSV